MEKENNEKENNEKENSIESTAQDTPAQNAFDITRKFKQSAPPPQAPQQKKKLVGVTDKKIETKRIIIFLLVCFGLAWFTEFFSIIPMYQSKDENLVKEASDALSQIMLAPTFAALAARLSTREGLLKSGFQFNFSEHKFLFLFGWFGMTALTFLGAVLYFMIFRDNFDPNMTNFVASYNAAATEAETDAVNIVASYKADLLIKVFTAAVLNILSSFGIEWGFRAYLLPKLFRKIGTIPAMLISGLVSGIWYAPLVILGYYYGMENTGYPIANIFAICIFSVITGIIYSFLCLRTGSIFPSVFAHSALSIMMQQAAFFTFDGGNPFVGPSPTGILSGLPLIITAAVCLIYMYKHPVKPSTA